LAYARTKLRCHVHHHMHGHVMTDALAESKRHIATAISPDQLATSPLVADQWIISSLLQKAIRRGESKIAQRAALAFYLHKKSAIWRRLLVIAFEDVGASSADVLAMTVAACTDAAFRKACGGDVAVALRLARLLSETPKDRSADYLICGAQDHPSLQRARHECESQSLLERLAGVADTADLRRCSLAVWYASGLATGKKIGGDLPALTDTFRALGVPEALASATKLAAERTREPITLMVPVIWLAAQRDRAPTVVASSVPRSVTIDDVPMYALDKHTRLGREAIAQFARENDAVHEVLERLVPKESRREAAMMAAFYADAAPVSKRLVWDGAGHLEAYGIETDFLKKGVPTEAHAPLLAAVRDNLDHLNQIRADRYRKKFALPGAADSRPVGGAGAESAKSPERTFFEILEGK
jgi:hypothetical protein